MLKRADRSLYRISRGTKKLRTRDRRRPQLQTESLEARLVLDSTVVFNEIMFNPPGETDDTLEWIEFHNQLAVDMDISDWELEGGVQFQFPDQTVVPGRGYLVVAADPVAFQAETGIAALGPFSGRLNNAGDQLRLYNNDQRLMNEVQYESGSHGRRLPTDRAHRWPRRAREPPATLPPIGPTAQRMAGRPASRISWNQARLSWRRCFR